MLRPYWICRRRRRSATCIICLAITYITCFNIAAILILYRTSLKRNPSALSKHGNLYLGFLNHKFSCKTPVLSNTKLPLTALVSFPGSGNTWIRHMLQQATGIVTGSVYIDESLKRKGFPGEGIMNSSTLVIKTHEWGEKERKKYERAILLLRNPYDALLAEFNRRCGGHMGHASSKHFQTEWKSYVQYMSDRWVKMTYDWLQYPGPIYIMKYENFKENPKAELTSMLAFLNITISFKEKLCVMKNLDGHHKRLNMKSVQYDPFTREMRTKIDADISFIENEMKMK